MKYYLTLDVGGTEIKCNIINEKSEFYFSKVLSFPAQSKGEKDEIIAHIVTIILTLVNQIDDFQKEIVGIGFAFPGPFDYENGVCLIQGLDKYESLYGVNLKNEIENALRNSVEKDFFSREVPIVFENDGKLFALGEATFGEGKGLNRLACFTLGTGCGSTFVENKVAVKGVRGIPEHGMIYDYPFRDSNIDDYLSVRGLRKITLDYFEEELSGKQLYEKALNDETNAKLVFEFFGKNIEDALSDILEKFDPDVIIFGGQISQSYPFFKKGFQDKIDISRIRISKDTSRSTMYGIYSLLKN